jgi:hypothetical protein
MLHDLNCLSIAELEPLATERMDKQTRDYYNESADGGVTVLENIAAYRKYRLRPRVLRIVSKIDSSVEVFGTKTSVPLGVAPAAMQRLAHPGRNWQRLEPAENKGLSWVSAHSRPRRSKRLAKRAATSLMFCNCISLKTESTAIR